MKVRTIDWNESAYRHEVTIYCENLADLHAMLGLILSERAAVSARTGAAPVPPVTKAVIAPPAATQAKVEPSEKPRIAAIRCQWCRKEVLGWQGLAPHQRACPKRPRVETKATAATPATPAKPSRAPAVAPEAPPLEAPAPQGVAVGVTAWLRRKGPPFGHSNDQVRRFFPAVNSNRIAETTWHFRKRIREEKGGTWSEVTGVWTWHPPAGSPPGYGTAPSDAPSTETRS